MSKSISLQLTDSEVVHLINELSEKRNYRRANELMTELVRSDPWNRAYQDFYIQRRLLMLAKEPGIPLDTQIMVLNRCIEFGHKLESIAPLYFSAMAEKHSGLAKRGCPGQLVLGLGPGRCGSTSLTTILGSAENSAVSHEARPLIGYPATAPQLDFHFRRFELLLGYNNLVGDVAHWWLYNVDEVLERFPQARFVVLHRSPISVVNSFLKVKSVRKNGENHWDVHDGSYWLKSTWDFVYPKFKLQTPNNLSKVEERAQQVLAYVQDYYKRCEQLPKEQTFHIQLENLSKQKIQELSNFLGLELDTEVPWKNKDTVIDSLTETKEAR